LSIELQVRLGRQVVTRALLFRDLSLELRRLFVLRDQPSWESDAPATGTLGADSATFDLRLGTEAEISVLSHSAGSEETLGEDGGFWVVFTVVIRSHPSELLMLLASMSLARIVGCSVLDESEICRRGRWVTPEEIEAIVSLRSGLPFDEASEVISSDLGRN
jgi:hypothetical protein